MTLKFPNQATFETTDFVWRSYRREDTRAVYELFVAVNQADNGTLSSTLQDVEAEYDDPWSHPETDARVVLAPDGQLAAFARVFSRPEPSTPAIAHVEADILPAYRERGLEEQVLAWVEGRATELLNERAADRPRFLRAGFPVHLKAQIERYQAHGYRPVRYFNRMRRDLHEPIPELPLPEGLALRRYGPDVDRRLFEAHEEAFHEHWGHEQMTEYDWQVFIVGRSAFRPDLTFVIMDGNQVAGYSINRVRTEENERLGINQGWIGSLGVRKPWRKRGLASALLCESMRAFRAQGMDYAGLGVDVENQTGALALYERLGFRAYYQLVALMKEI